jgi:alpha/beta superfamily hydrolase
VKYQSVQGPAGALQVLEEKPEGEPLAIGVICHPHPLHGGTLTNKVVHQLARTFTELGTVSIRFNFRGVGESDGCYDDGRGEVDDLLAVIEWAQQRWPDLPLWVAGFSFGGVVALKGVHRTRADRLITVAPAVNHFPADTCQLSALPWLLIQGEADDVVPAAQVMEWIGKLDYQPQLALLQGAGHFFHGRLNDVRQAIISAIATNQR